MRNKIFYTGRMLLSGILILLSLSAVYSNGNEKDAYRLYDNKGKKSSYAKLLKAAADADIVLFGEFHNNPICHWLQLELTSDLHKNDSNLVLGAEMFEADNQIILDEYLSGLIREKSFEKDARLWPNYDTDYKPLVQLALNHQLPFIATNIPRRYANVVYMEGFEGLNNIRETAKNWIAPLPIKYDPNLKAYADMLQMGHGGENLPKAQAIKDATMAYFILENRQEGQRFIHYNGTYHSNNFEGIVWYLRQSNPDLKIITIASVEQDSINSLEKEHINRGDFILCIPSSMTKTH